MTIATAIQNAQQKVANAYTAISGKGGTLPATQDLSNMPTAINSITTVNNTTLSVTPTTSSQSHTPSSPYTGYGSVSVNAVTSSIDNNIQAGNIKEGVTILGVLGTYQGGITPSGSITLNANATYDVTNYANAVVNVPNGNTAIWGATIEDIFENTNYNNTQPTNHEVVMNVTSHNMTNNGTSYRYCNLFRNSGIKKFTCNTSSANATNWMYEICRDAKYLEEVSFPNLTTANGTSAFESAFRMTYTAYTPKVKKISFPNLTSASSQYAFRYAFIGAVADGCIIDFGKLTTIGQQAFYQAFTNSPGEIENLSFDKVTSVGQYGCQALWSSTTNGGPKKASFDALVSIIDAGAFYQAFNGNKKLTELSFASLKTIGAQYGFRQLCSGCTSIKKLNLKNLYQISEQSCMENMLNDCSSMPTTYCFESLERLGGNGYAFMKNMIAGSCSIQNLFLPSVVRISNGNATASNAVFNGNTFSKIYPLMNSTTNSISCILPSLSI